MSLGWWNVYLMGAIAQHWLLSTGSSALTPQHWLLSTGSVLSQLRNTGKYDVSLQIAG